MSVRKGAPHLMGGLFPHIQHKDNGHCTLTHTPHTYSIRPGPGTDTPGGQPAPGPRRWSPFFQDGDRQTAPAPAQTSAGTVRNGATPAQTTTPHRDPSLQQPLSPSGEGATFRRRVYLVQTGPPNRAAPGSNSLTPPINSNFNLMSPPPPINPNMNLPTGPPPTRTEISDTCPQTQKQPKKMNSEPVFKSRV
ncbi:hypothetical protein AMECASPLE_026901 [Ameca splendens]|uniref:Uncharacterized protein n=1 Tax=Ameca splendens TaxID=208324 RepID=A0ABV0Z2Y2_9TELE